MQRRPKLSRVLDIFDAAFAADPWPTLAGLRADGGVHRVHTPDGPPAWLVTRYANVRAGLLDSRLSTNVRHAGGTDYRGFVVPPPLDANLLNTEPADLLRLRRVVTAELSPRRIADVGADVGARLLAQAPDGTLDVVAQLAVPATAHVIGDMLGLAPTQRDALLGWARATLAPGAAPRARDTLSGMLGLIRDVVAQAQESRSDTTISRIAAHPDVTGAELAGLVFYLLFVWYEVFVDLLAGGILTLAQHTGEFVPGSVDELLRFLSPQVLAGPRFALTDLSIGDRVVRRGETVLLCLAAANRDPEVFVDPDTFDPARDPNPHLGLGYGGHACLGSALVRPVAAEIFRQFQARWPQARQLDPNINWRSGFRHRGPLELRLALT